MARQRRRVLVLGPDKRLAKEAFARCAPTAQFVNLARISSTAANVPGQLLADAADRIMAKDPFDAIVATSESTMLSAGFLRSRYGLPGLTYDQTMTVTNKWQMRSLTRPRVRSPEAWLSGDFVRRDVTAEAVVIKPLSSSSARGVRIMPTEQARAWLRNDGGLWLVEEEVAVDREFHCDGAICDNRIQWIEISEYDRPVLASHGTRATSVLRSNDPIRRNLLMAAHQVVEALSVEIGVFHMELLQGNQGLFFGEVGLRPAGAGIAQMLRLALGADLWAAFVASQIGSDVRAYGPTRVVNETSGVIMARPGANRRSPIPRSAAAALPGVIATGDGNMAAGVQPETVCHFEYLAFFEGLDHGSVSRLRDTVSGTHEDR